VELNHDLPTPLYQQVYDIWKRKIETGELRPGDRIPTERELCEMHGVSQITVRQAIQMLVQEGLVIRRPRTGTRVAQRKFSQQLVKLTSFSEDMRSRGLVPGGRVVLASEEEADVATARALRLDEGSLVVMIERVRLAEGEPMAIEVFRMPAALCPGLLDEYIEDKSLYELLRTRYHIDPIWAKQSFEASLCKSREAELLGIRRGAPVLRVERIAYDSSETPIEYTASVYRGDRYKLHVYMNTR
jgi:GntR family transcriptional regulator